MKEFKKGILVGIPKEEMQHLIDVSELLNYYGIVKPKEEIEHSVAKDTYLEEVDIEAFKAKENQNPDMKKESLTRQKHAFAVIEQICSARDQEKAIKELRDFVEKEKSSRKQNFFRRIFDGIL